MDVNIIRSGDVFREDVLTTGSFSTTIWTAFTGTPTYSSGVIVVNQDFMGTKNTFERPQMLIDILIPAVPTEGDVRQWGLAGSASNSPQFIFDITDDVFSAVVIDNTGEELSRTTIPWDSDWTNAQIIWGITVFEREVHFLAEGALLCKYIGAIQKDPVAVIVKNENADDMKYRLLSVT